MKRSLNLSLLAVVALAASLLLQNSALAKQGATDPIPGTSKGAVKSGGGGGGGGGKSSTPTPTPTPVPPPPAVTLASGPLTFTASGPLSGGSSTCSGDYRVDPYYPTLLDMTVNVSVGSLPYPDGTILTINVLGAGGTLYPWTSNVIVVVGGTGTCSEHVFVTLGASLAGVEITDSNGAVVFTGN